MILTIIRESRHFLLFLHFGQKYCLWYILTVFIVHHFWMKLHVFSLLWILLPHAPVQRQKFSQTFVNQKCLSFWNFVKVLVLLFSEDLLLTDNWGDFPNQSMGLTEIEGVNEKEEMDITNVNEYVDVTNKLFSTVDKRWRWERFTSW